MFSIKIKLLYYANTHAYTDVWCAVGVCNRPFPSSLVPLFQSDSKCETILMKNDFDLHENETACRTNFHMKGFALSPARFETEAQDNSEMAY